MEKIKSTESERYNVLNEMYPERMVIKVKQGTKELLKQEVRNRGFSSISTMVRAALRHSLKDPNFKK